jgi:hypothetical protein
VPKIPQSKPLITKEAITGYNTKIRKLIKAGAINIYPDNASFFLSDICFKVFFFDTFVVELDILNLLVKILSYHNKILSHHGSLPK